MKKTSILFAALLLAAVSCTKEGNDSGPKKMDITLTASIADLQTKTVYTDPADGTLKMDWEATGETISVVTYDATNGIIRNEVLTGTKSGTDCLFSGTVTELESGQKYLCIYPALSGPTTIGGKTCYTSEKGALQYVVEDKKFTFTHDKVKQEKNGSTDHLKYADLLTGEPTFSGGNAVVSLEHQIGVLKVVLSLTPEYMGRYLNGFKITDSYTPSFTPDLKVTDFSSFAFIPGESLFSLTEVLDGENFIVGLDLMATFYIPMAPCTIPADGYYRITVTEGITDKSINKNPPVAVNIEKGKMTTLKISGGSDVWI